MSPRRRLAVAILLAWPSAAAATETIRIEYAASVMGIPVGRGVLEAEVSDAAYTASFDGRVKGLARLFTDGHFAAEARGALAADRLQPSEYVHRMVEDDDEERVRLGFEGSRAASVSAEPPRRNPDRYMPVAPADLAAVIDPLSAALWPAGQAGQTCDRALPLFDGRHRFDIRLSYKGTEAFTARDGSYSGEAVVCAMRYVPISGHRPDKKSVIFMAANEDMQVWMAPVGDGSLLAPVKLDIRADFGRVVLEARHVGVD
jgi:hypothetical protein